VRVTWQKGRASVSRPKRGSAKETTRKPRKGHRSHETAFRPEFLNRIDDIVVFRSLSRQELLKIVDLMLTEVKERVKERGIDISVSQEARDFLLEKGYDPKYGARPLRRTIQRMVEDRLADLFLEGRFKEGARVGIEPGEDQLAFTEIPS